jgi:hypothetical protein
MYEGYSTRFNIAIVTDTLSQWLLALAIELGSELSPKSGRQLFTVVREFM